MLIESVMRNRLAAIGNRAGGDLQLFHDPARPRRLQAAREVIIVKGAFEMSIEPMS
jgi:hypothetical protein